MARSSRHQRRFDLVLAAGLSVRVDVPALAQVNDNNNVPGGHEPTSGVIYVDDNAPNDPGPRSTDSSDPDENGSLSHPYDAIQEAIDAAFPDDVIVVRDGTYWGIGNRSISFRGKPITVRSENGPENCVVDVQYLQPAFVFSEGESRTSRLEEITLINGPNDPPFPDNTAHILCTNSSPTIAGCTVVGGRGSGFLLRGSVNPLIRSCTISNNSNHGINAIEGASATVRRCAIIGNGIQGIRTFDLPGSVTIVNSWILNNGNVGLDLRGENEHTVHNCVLAANSYGIFLTSGTIARILNCTVVENHEAGIRGCGAIVRNSIVRDNTLLGDIYCSEGSVSVRYSNVGVPSGTSIGPTNIDSDPQFLDPDNGDFRLGRFSPGNDAASNDEAPLDIFDLDGDGDTTEIIPFDLDGRPRILDAPDRPDTGVGSPPIDMGAYEFSDCNDNDVPDQDDIAAGTSQDCNGNSFPDACDISFGFASDCNNDGVPDNCEADCDGNGLPDNCEWRDCNRNDVFDVCDIQGGTSLDEDGTNIPDECECPPPAPLPGPDGMVTNRYLAVNANTPLQTTAIRVTLSEMPPGFESFIGKELWIGPPTERCENSGQPVVPAEGCGSAPGIEPRRIWTASLVCDPFYTDWGQYGTVYVHHRLVVPGATYTIEATEELCEPIGPPIYSPPSAQAMSSWGDVVKDNATCPRPEPDGSVDVVTDVVALIQKFANDPCAVRKARGDLQPGSVDFVVDIVDAVHALGAFAGDSYPFTPGPDPCP